MRPSRNAEAKIEKQVSRARMSFKSDEKQISHVRVSFKSKEVANSNSWQRESIPCSNDFVFILDCASDVIVDEYSNTDNAWILESDQWGGWTKACSRIWCKHMSTTFNALNRSLLKISCAIQVRQKLVTFDMSRPHWHDEEKVLWHDDCLYVSIEFYRKNVAHAGQSLTEHLMWNASWSQYESIVDRIKQTKWSIGHRARF